MVPIAIGAALAGIFGVIFFAWLFSFPIELVKWLLS